MREIPLFNIADQYERLRQEIQEAVEQVLSGGQYILGPEVEAFEQGVADYAGVRYGIGVANGTDALLLALEAAGVGPGDEVITTPFTFFATAEAISRTGAVPVFVDIDPQTYNLDISQLEAKVSPRTKGIIPVHLFGQPVDMHAVNRFAQAHDLFVLEDAAQGMGGEYRGRKIGSMGHAATFSFFPTKNLGGYGDGGMIVTDDDEIKQKVRSLRVHGSHPKSKYRNERLGYNSRLDALQAAILNIKLGYLDHWNQLRRTGADCYDQLLEGVPVQVPFRIPGGVHVFHLYVIQTERRDQLRVYLKEKGIETGVYYSIPLHLQPVYHHLGYQEGDLPKAEYAAQRSLALPLYPGISQDTLVYITETIRGFFR
ncbi:DegT/DnrJ/EryC1/StrS family aminotransferase [Kroppenstedtia pulmonis]|uniref:DegT/DnrJ/EryC1/StrS family aminotransferase n=1 Tax=Kroppenstedtia pulmonis TaxID=1380685 RepID=A0A7D4BM05_9BACL|nr:DegT/DnrJ/EryC1/StrS family aminotransferase [Kroppenstedtia pulmonis]QKG85690.1 DegT/DnrJ/EryC1/StrS family aminotransferase [Kroppenstedtia pulmonis]